MEHLASREGGLTFGLSVGANITAAPDSAP